MKINNWQKVQERNLVITSNNFYNVRGTTIRWSIDIKTFDGISRNIQYKNSNLEFILHREKEKEYRYISEK